MGNQNSQINPDKPSPLGHQVLQNLLTSKFQETANQKDQEAIETDQILLGILNLTKKSSLEYNDIKILQDFEDDFEGFMEKVQNIVSTLYLKLSKISIEKLNSEDMSEIEFLIFFAEEVLHTTFNILKVIGQKFSFQYKPQILDKVNKIQIEVIKYLKNVYSRGQKNYVPYELTKQFVQFNMIEQPEFDILEHKQIYFGSEDPANIALVLKKMINFLILETEANYPIFQKLLHEKIFLTNDGKDHLPFEFSSAISETVSLVDQNSSSFQDIKNPEILNILLKWIQDIEDYVCNPSEQILEKDYYKFVSNEELGEFTHISPEEIEDIIELLRNILKSHQEQYTKRISDLKEDLSIFTWNILKIFSKSERKEKFVSEKDAQIIRFSMNSSYFLRWILLERLQIVIKMLVKTGTDIQDNLKMKMDLIKFNAPDLFKAQATVNKKQIVEVFTNMKKLQEKQEIKIIQIVNNLETIFSDVKIVFKFAGCELFCEITLLLAQSNKFFDKKYKNIQFLNTLYDKLEKSENGVMYQLAIIINNYHSIIDYDQHLHFFPINISPQKCKENHFDKLQIQTIQQKPFVCTSCSTYYQQYSNLFELIHCKICSYFLCFRCITKNDKQQLKNQCYNAIRGKIKKKLSYVAILQKSYMKTLDVSQRSGQIDFTDNKIISGYTNFFRDAKILFLKDIQSGNKIKKKTLLRENIYPFKYGVLGKFSQGELYLYFFQVINEKSQTDARIQFQFNVEMNLADSITFSEYDFITLHDTKLIYQSDLTQNNFKFIYLNEATSQQYQQVYKTSKVNIFSHKVNNVSFYLIFCISSGATTQMKIQYNKESIQSLRSHLPNVKQTQQIYELSGCNLGDSHLGYFKEVEWRGKIKELSLKRNSITDISILLGLLIGLQKLNVSHNQLTLIKFTKPLLNLKKLYCSHNKIYAMDGMDKISNIEVINCSENSIQSFQITKLLNLRDLDLNLNRLGQSINNLRTECYPSLSNLRIGYENVHFTAPVVIELKKLKSLTLGYLSCEKLDLNTAALESLVFQQVDINQLTVSSFHSLKIINISYSYIHKLQTILNSPMPFLQSVTIQSSTFSQMPIFNSPNLTKIAFYQTSTSSISNMNESFFPGLQSLIMSGTSFSEMPIIKSGKLQTIQFLSNYSFQNIQKIQKWETPKVKHLGLGDLGTQTRLCQIKLPLLQTLSIYGGQISSEYVFNQNKLKSLTLNSITSNDFPIIRAPALQTLELNNCFFKTLDNLSKLFANNLKKIQIYSNSGDEDAKFPFFSAPQLTNLQVTYCMILNVENLSRISFPQLQILNFSRNSIQKIPVVNAPKLTSFNMSQNAIIDATNLSHSKLPLLQCLNLQSNPDLTTMPVLDFPALTRLDINRSGILGMEWLQQCRLPNMKILQMSQVWVEHFNLKKELSMPKLEKLGINLAKIDSLDFYGKLVCENVRELKIQYAPSCIVKVPIFNFPQATLLSIRHTFITDMSNLQFSTFSQLATLDLYNNKFFVFPTIKMPKLKLLKCKNQKKQDSLTDISNLGLSSLPELNRLQLEDNRIAKIPKLEMPSLEQMFIYKNYITDINQFVESNLPKLSLINICNNPIVRLPLGKNVSPEEIYMTEARVEDFTPLVRYAPQIFRFYYTKAAIATPLPAFNFAKANRVQFEQCELVNIDSFSEFSYPVAEQISFVGNALQKAPGLVCPSLKRLYFNKNKIKDARDLFTKSDFPKIDMFSVESNEIEDLVDFPFTNVYEVFFSHNLFTDISCMSKYEYHRLNMLVIYNVKVSKLCCFNAPEMRKLYLNQNLIEDLTPLIGSKLPKLQLLNLNNNQIKDISTFEKLHLPNMHSLYLTSNQIQTLTGFKPLEALQILNINKNPVKNIKKILQSKLSSLSSILITLSHLPAEEFQKMRAQLTEVYPQATIQ